MTSRRLPVLLVLLALAVAAYVLCRPRPYIAAPEPATKTAFLRAEWGMSPEQVTQANGFSLAQAQGGKRFYEALPGEEDRYRTLEASGHRFLGRNATVHYTFKDGHLTSYHLFISDADCEALDKDTRRYLERRFGPGSGEEEEGSALRLVWQTRERVVNYWFFEDELALSKPCRAVFGVRDLS